MRYYSNPAFKRSGAFTNPDPAVRREAIESPRQGIDAARGAGSNLMTLGGSGRNGFGSAPFEAGDYARLWTDEIDGIREVAEHDPDCLVLSNISPMSRDPTALCLTARRRYLRSRKSACPTSE